MPLIRKWGFLAQITVLGTVLSAGLYLATPIHSEIDYTTSRTEMVKTQIVSRGVKDKRVLDAMLKVERHRFVPVRYRRRAYNDYPLPIGDGQTISQPYIVALMTELLELKSTDRVLEIGTGSGYQAAVLGELAGEVYSIEIIETLAGQSKKLLKKLKYKNVHIRAGDGFAGWPEKAPFNGIIVTCAPTKIPEPLKNQLAEGGRMVIPVGDYSQELVLVTKKNGKLSHKSIIPVRFVPMTGQIQEE